MPNPNAPFGFRAIRHGGGAPNFQLASAQIAYNNSTKIHQGAPLKQLTTGYIDLAGVNDYPLIGVFESVEYYDTGQKRKYAGNAWLAPTTTAAQGTVVAKYNRDFNTRYEVRSSGAAITIADVGANAKHAAGTASDLTGLSGASLDQTTINTTNTLQWRIEGLSDKGENDNASSYNIVEVLLVRHFDLDSTGIA
jgi:hypothetical protein